MEASLTKSRDFRASSRELKRSDLTMASEQDHAVNYPIHPLYVYIYVYIYIYIYIPFKGLYMVPHSLIP